MTARRGTVEEQIAAQAALSTVANVFTLLPSEQYDRETILMVLDLVRTDPIFFDPDIVASFDASESARQAKEKACLA